MKIPATCPGQAFAADGALPAFGLQQFRAGTSLLCTHQKPLSGGAETAGALNRVCELANETTLEPARILEAQNHEGARKAVLLCSHRLYRDGNDADAWHALGIALVALGDRVAAFIALRNAASLDGGRSSTQLALGNLLFDSGRFDDALRCFEAATARELGRSLGEK